MKAPKKPMGSEIRAQREQWATPEAEAARHEQSFLSNLSRAQSDFEWIVEHQAWTVLGHDSLAEWWAAKVQPVMSALSMRITPEMATRVIEKVKAAEAHLPASQRHSARDLAALVGTSEWTARGRQDRDKRRDAPHPDLEKPAADPFDSISDEAKAAIQARLDQTAGLVDDPRVDESGEDRPATAELGEAEDGGPSSAADVTDPSATPTEPASSPEDAEPVNGREQPEPAGVSGPAAPAPELVNTPIGPMPKSVADVLDKHAPDPNPHREWQKTFLDDVFTMRRLLRKYGGDEIAEKADAQLLEEFANLAADCEEKQREVSKAQIARSNAKVFKLRSVQ